MGSSRLNNVANPTGCCVIVRHGPIAAAVQSTARITWEALKKAQTRSPARNPMSSAPERVMIDVKVLPPPMSSTIYES